MKTKKRKVIHLKKKENAVEINCLRCQIEFRTENDTQRFCDDVCKQMYQENKKKKRSQKFNAMKLDYPKLTFRLSFIGFVGSIAFYLGVLRDLHNSPIDQTEVIEQLNSENQELKNQLDSLNVTENK